MNLLKWNRGSGLARGNREPLVKFRNEFDRLFDRFFMEPWTVTDFAEMLPTMWMPATDIAEDDNNIIIRAEVPGIEAKDIDLNVLENRLTISGEKNDEKEEKGKDTYYRERNFGSFRRVIDLPANVDATKVVAEYANGVLTVTVPKPVTAKARQIEVKPAVATTQPQRTVVKPSIVDRPVEATPTAPQSQRVPVGAGR